MDECGTLSMMDYINSREQTEHAIQRAGDGADDEWKDEALTAIYDLAKQHKLFIADDIWLTLKKPREPRALGFVMRIAAKKGWIQKTGRYRESTLRHHCPVAEWESLIFQA